MKNIEKMFFESDTERTAIISSINEKLAILEVEIPKLQAKYPNSYFTHSIKLYYDEYYKYWIYIRIEDHDYCLRAEHENFNMGKTVKEYFNESINEMDIEDLQNLDAELISLLAE